MSLPPEVIGRIILSKFLSFSLKRYEKVISEVENLPICRALFPDIITFEMFRRARAVPDKKGLTQNTLGRIEQDHQDFYIRYRCSGFAGEYSLDRGKLTGPTESGDFQGFEKDEIDL
ncbi:MAG: hypothetical protein KAV99_04335 [Candidatus Latescibacteria bacterium]|nr:hypothetical protein [Candidatus Latescibacterota bacterium]